MALSLFSAKYCLRLVIYGTEFVMKMGFLLSALVETLPCILVHTIGTGFRLHIYILVHSLGKYSLQGFGPHLGVESKIRAAEKVKPN